MERKKQTTMAGLRDPEMDLTYFSPASANHHEVCSQLRAGLSITFLFLLLLLLLLLHSLPSGSWDGPSLPTHVSTADEGSALYRTAGC